MESQVCDFHICSFQRCGSTQNGSNPEMDPSCCSLDLLMERIKGKDLKLLEVNKENKVLKIKVRPLEDISNFVF